MEPPTCSQEHELEHSSHEGVPMPMAHSSAARDGEGAAEVEQWVVPGLQEECRRSEEMSVGGYLTVLSKFSGIDGVLVAETTSCHACICPNHTTSWPCGFVSLSAEREPHTHLSAATTTSARKELNSKPLRVPWQVFLNGDGAHDTVPELPWSREAYTRIILQALQELGYRCRSFSLVAANLLLPPCFVSLLCNSLHTNTRQTSVFFTKTRADARKYADGARWSWRPRQVCKSTARRLSSSRKL